MRVLDRSRAYAYVFGEAPHSFEQDGIRFDQFGNELVTEVVVPVAEAPAPVSVAEQMKLIKGKG